MLETKYRTMSDGHEIFVRTYTPESEPIGSFYILHGMGEHGDRYDSFAKLLCKEGFKVYTHDHRGHGKTVERNGILGHFADEKGFDRVVQDVYEIVQQTEQQDGYLRPRIIFGHSMGSFIARRFIQIHSSIIDACILCGTGTTTTLHKVGNLLANYLAAKEGKQVESKFMNDMTFTSFNKQFDNIKTPFDWLSTNEKEVEKYQEDPLCGFIPTHQFFADLTEGLLTIHKKEENAKIRRDLPVLLISGSDDPVGNNGAGVYKVANQLKNAGLAHVVVYLFEQMRHEILNEKNNEHVYDVIIRWLKHEQSKH